MELKKELVEKVLSDKSFTFAKRIRMVGSFSILHKLNFDKDAVCETMASFIPNKARRIRRFNEMMKDYQRYNTEKINETDNN